MESRYGLTLMSDEERAEYYKREVEKKMRQILEAESSEDLKRIAEIV